MTATEDRCPLTELPKTGCSHCRGDRSHPAEPDRVTLEEVGARFDAGYDGHCGNCGGRIRTGDVIARLLDGSGWACTECLP